MLNHRLLLDRRCRPPFGRLIAVARRHWWLMVRLAFSAGIVGLLLTIAHVGRVKGILAGAELLPLVASAGLYFVGTLLFAYRWRLVLEARNPDPLGVRFLVGAFLIGLFFNFFLPSSVGGDVARAELVRSHMHGRTEAYTSVLFDRLVAFNATLAISFAAALVALLRLGWFEPYVAGIWLFCASGSVAFVVLILWRPFFGEPLTAGGGVFSTLRFQVARLRGALRGYMTNLRLVGQVFLLAVATQLVAAILVVWLLAEALGIETPLLFPLIAVPIIELIALVPVSFNGIGLREGAFVFLYAQAGVAAEAALALSLAWTLLLFAFSLVGGLCWLWPRLYDGHRTQLLVH